MPEYNFEPTKRFSNRARDYARFRPDYPNEIVSFVQSTWNIEPGSFVADLGAGTGIFAKIFLEKGYNVICVEPNQEMLHEAEDYLRDFSGAAFTNGSGENTGLQNDSVDLVTIAQAFHWMDPESTRSEVDRILKPGGRKLLVWNIQKNDTPFMQAYIDFKDRYSIKQQVPTRINPEKMALFFDGGNYESQTLLNEQSLDFDGLKGQLLSSSYLPLPGDDQFDTMLDELNELYKDHQENDQVTMRFDTKLYFQN